MDSRVDSPRTAPPFAALAGTGLIATMGAGLAALTLMPAAGGAGAVAAALVPALVAALAARPLAQSHPFPQLGPANVVTLLRTGIVGLVAGALFLPVGLAEKPALAMTLVALVAAGLALDGVDGWLARRSGLASPFGARLDMEVDSLLAAILCLLVIVSGKAGLWLLPLGFLRYAWVLAGLVLPWLRAPLEDRAGRKTACVLQIAVLIALLAPQVTPPLSTGMAAFATLALVVSFAVDAVWLWRRR